MGASKSMSKDKSMDASNSRADSRRNTFNCMDARNRGNICINTLKIEIRDKVTVAHW
jgi:hypothetical protein